MVISAGRKELFYPEPKFYVAHNNDEATIKKSASGGAFSALSNYVLKQQGVIYGVVLDEALNIRHSRATTVAERDKMCSSKYVQSRIGATYKLAKHDLEAGKTVLFTGTSCQIAGLKAFLGKAYPKLYLCDLMCHSVPSPLIWQEYLQALAGENGQRVTYVNFRDKTKGWQRASTLKGFAYAGDDGKLKEDNRFYKLFFREKLISRLSCATCKYVRVQRVSDIIIADYWGVEKYLSDWVDYYGVSFIMTSTEKGQQLLEACQQKTKQVHSFIEE